MQVNINTKKTPDWIPTLMTIGMVFATGFFMYKYIGQWW